MPATIPITGANVVAGTNNSTYKFDFPISANFPEGTKIALQSLNLFYSWNNITAAYNNNTFSYKFPAGGISVTTVNLTVPDGFYTIEQLNAYLQSVMVANGDYLIDSSGNYVYYLEITTNSSLYAVQLNAYPVPTSLPSGWTAPAGWSGYPPTAACPQFVIPNTAIQSLLGINAGTYPPTNQSTSYSTTSTFTPQVSPVSSVFVLCSLVNNPLSRPYTILYNFSPNVQFGSQISITPPYLVYQRLNAGVAADVIITFTDQNYNPLFLDDSNVSIMLAVKGKDED